MLGPLIEVDHLTKTYGRHPVVDALSFRVEPGHVTGFLGPNGAGKSTTLRCMVGLDHPDAGQVTFDGLDYRTMARPSSLVGCVFDSGGAHPARRAIDHLRWVAAAQGNQGFDAASLLERVGLGHAARAKVGGFSLGMRQRLGLATALIGDPSVLLLDEPLNGLDPDGVHWMRSLLTEFAANGGTILISSHLLAELALTADHLVIITAGRLAAAGSLVELTAGFDTLEDAYFALTRGGAK